MRTRVPHSANYQTRYEPSSAPRVRSGITLIETVIAISLATFAAGALLTALGASVQTSTGSLHIAIANGLADQLMDEIASVNFPTGSGSGATSGTGRMGYSDLDSYNGYNVSPPQARNGSAIGQEGTSTSGIPMTRPQQFRPDPLLLSRYRQQVTVEKVVESGSSWVVASQSSTLRRVTVTISYTDATGKMTALATQIRIFSNVSVAP